MKVYVLNRAKDGFKILEGNIKEEDRNKKHIKVETVLGSKHYKKGKIFFNREKAEGEGERRIKQFFKNCNARVCSYCGKKIDSIEQCTLDHIMPMSECEKKGKTWEETWKFANLTLSCVKCNKSKGSKHYRKFMGIEKKSHYLRRKTFRKHNKFSNILNHRIDNVFEIAKKDSRCFNLNLFFGKTRIKC